MNFGYVKVGALSPKTQIANVEFNANNIIQGIKDASSNGVEVLVFPELVLSGATCGDLFFDKTLLIACKKYLEKIAQSTLYYNGIIFVGLPMEYKNLIYNVCAVINSGRVIAFVPKTNTQSFYDVNKGRFSTLTESGATVDFCGYSVPFTNKVIFKEQNNDNFTIACEFGQDLFGFNPCSCEHVLQGATIIACPSSLCMTVGKTEFLTKMLGAHSQKCICGYVYSESGDGETSTDVVFAGANLIYENGKELTANKPFTGQMAISEIDTEFISYERSKEGSFKQLLNNDYKTITFSCENKSLALTRKYEKLPFLPLDLSNGERAELILDIQAEGLKKRIVHTNANKVVIGLSGGLDSTLALIATVNAMKKANRNLKDVIAVTMPCFGTTGRTLTNSVKLAKALGVTLKKIEIAKAVNRHFKDIEHDGRLDVTYENAQARERTQVLMDLANMYGGMVVGTGDLSELALGWATYNGDHMSMFGVNGGLPKTLIRYLVSHYASKSKTKIKSVLNDILDTPVSPELLPANNDKISQKTEDIVGPYILHDFFIYNYIRRGFSPQKMYFVAKQTFEEEFDGQTILKWLKTFVRRFFNQQFKRSCLPDGVKIGTVGLSPRMEWQMPSDAISKLWLDSLENL